MSPVFSKWVVISLRSKEAEDSEIDMLELAAGYDENRSRLACQMKINDIKLEHVTFIIPKHANNLFDFIPFEDEMTR